MDILFIHPSYPGQFSRIAPIMAKLPNVSICAMGEDVKIKVNPDALDYPLIQYHMPESSDTTGVHAFAQSYNEAAKRATVVANTLIQHKYQGYEPDVIFVHPGWGDSIFLKEVFPHAKIIGLLEYYYHFRGADVGFDDEFPYTMNDVFNVRSLNSVHAMALETLDECFSPTHWQKSRFPKVHQDRIRVIHDGIDTDKITPNNNAVLTLASGLSLSSSDEVITFVNRDLEPYRGYHKFMRALPAILKERPNCQVLIIGGDGASYGKKAPEGKTWKSIFLDEVKHEVDLSRIHFTGKLPYQDFLLALQVSSVHVYLTYPFVLSWSLLEAMSASCLVVGSSTAPVEEVITHGENGLLVPFHDSDALANQVIEVLNQPEKYEALRNRARQTVIEKYDFKTVSLPAFFELLNSDN